VKIPHSIKYDRFWPTFFGKLSIGRPFTAWTFGFWTFLNPDYRLTYDVLQRVIRHEYQHVIQFVLGWGVGVVAFILCYLIDPLSFWWLLLSPLTFSFSYAIASLVAFLGGGHPYRDNFFEVEARGAAGELR
jgi:hypothetical protein